jgi:hypothetical protein
MPYSALAEHMTRMVRAPLIEAADALDRLYNMNPPETRDAPSPV